MFAQTEQVPLERIYLMTLLTLAFYVPTHWYFLIPFITLLSACLLFRRVLYHWLFWTAVTALVGFTLAQLWLTEGNHMYLLFYLSLTCLVTALSTTPQQTFALNARLIIGTVFALATFWKLVSPSFTSGTFFTYYILHDERLAPIGMLLTELSRDDIRANQEAVRQVLNRPAALIIPLGVGRLAHCLTWLTLTTEGLVALVFLAKWSFRDAVLILFLATAYLVIPVPSFGMALACLGYGQTSSQVIKTLYLVAFILMPLTSLRYFLISF